MCTPADELAVSASAKRGGDGGNGILGRGPRQRGGDACGERLARPRSSCRLRRGSCSRISHDDFGGCEPGQRSEQIFRGDAPAPGQHWAAAGPFWTKRSMRGSPGRMLSEGVNLPGFLWRL